MKKIKDDRVKWGIIGAGNVCEVKSVPAMYKIPDSEVIAVMRRNAAKAKDFAQRHNIHKWYNSANDIINDPEINTIYISTPPDSHAELTKLSAFAGKAVYVEKPMARNYAETLDMITACKTAGVPLYVAYYRRALPAFLKIKELITNNEIGEVRLVEIQMYKALNSGINMPDEKNWRINPEISGGGHFVDLATHQLDFLDFLFGRIKHVSGFAANQSKIYRADDIVSASFIFENGVICNGTWCFTTGNISEREKVLIIGSKGEIEFQTFGNANIILRTDTAGESIFRFEHPQHIQQPLITQVVNDLLGKDICWSTGITGSRTNWVLDQIYKTIF